MGRKPSRAGAVPRLRVRRTGSLTRYYYDHGIVNGKRWREPLGTDYAAAIRRWAELEGEQNIPAARATLRDVADAYRREVIPTKAERTQRDNLRELGRLLAFFDDPPAQFEALEPQHVRQYLRWRKGSPVRANREKALLSHIWNWAREQGYTAKPNPCAGVHGNRESGRKIYVDDAQFATIHAKADPVTQTAMDLAYLTGQRPSDVLRMSLADVRDGVLEVRQGKTGALVRIVVEGELASVIEGIKAQASARKVASMRMLANDHGHVIGLNALSRRFRAAVEAAGLSGIQLRDLRAKAATYKAEAVGDARQAQRQLGHTSVVMTEHYIRARRGEKVTPTR
ncbi:MAG TPA: tyrosine-type recombinase/integrase [Rhodanobacteraceae bacterium]|nr:tyrosine-type recombinase/integrase [Rhodanobacteraceae bacterium]